MELLPRTTGTRPRIAVEIRRECVVAARAEEGAGLLAAVARVVFERPAMEVGTKATVIANRSTAVAGVRQVLESVTSGGKERARYVTLVVPDSAARVLLLDFDALPAKPSEALPIVRFRLKKLLPFDADHAVVSFQTMETEGDQLRVLVVAMPCDVLSEYEALVTDAGFQAGAVLPSTLAAVAGLPVTTTPTLVVNAGPDGVTTAIVRGDVMTLHRTVDLRAAEETPTDPHAAELTDTQLSDRARVTLEAPERISTHALVQAWEQQKDTAEVPSYEDAVVAAVNRPHPVTLDREVGQAVSVAVAYFEDTVQMAPESVLSAGTMSADELRAVLEETGFAGLRVEDMVTAEMLGAGASTTRVDRGSLAGVRGALRS